MDNLIILSDLKIDQYAKVVELKSDEFIKRRLQDIRIVKDTLIECKLISKGIKGYLINNTLFAIREEDAKKIIIELI